MIILRTAFALSVLTALVPTAYAQATAISSAPSSKSSAADQEFFLKAAQGGHTEVEASKLAATKASSDQVKAFAQQMVADHTKAGDELTSLAGNKGVTLPAEPSSAQKAKIKTLEGKTGADFDRSYAKSIGVEAHRETVALFKKAASSAKDPDVKAFAQKTLPTLEHHLKMAEDLNKAVSKS